MVILKHNPSSPQIIRRVFNSITDSITVTVDGVLTIDATDLDIRDLVSSSDSVEIKTASGQPLTIDSSGFITAKISGGIVVASSALPAGASTSANQTTGNNSLSSIDTKLTSNATSTLQTTGNNSLSSIDGKLTDNATATLQVAGNTSLSNIDTKVSTAANQITELDLIGLKTEAAPASDTASSGLNGRLQRIAQRLSTLISDLTSGIYKIIITFDRVGVNSLTGIDDTYDNVTTANSSADIDISGGYKRATFMFSLVSANTPTRFLFFLDVKNSDGTTYHRQVNGLWSRFGYEDAGVASGVDHSVTFDLPVCETIRIRVTAQGTSATNTFTLSNSEIYLGN